MGTSGIDPNWPQIHLSAGALCCRVEPSVLSTVLGSCVSVALWDRERGIGGLNHFVLPSRGNEPPSLRYGDCAIDRLIESMLDLGASLETLDAKLFGGAAVLPANSVEESVGTHNVDFALARLNSLGISIVARRTGGRNGMSIQLFTVSGDVLVRQIPILTDK
jgi:chemotaxis receptor (MCP) glutamine deamidase CheD